MRCLFVAVLFMISSAQGDWFSDALNTAQGITKGVIDGPGNMLNSAVDGARAVVQVGGDGVNAAVGFGREQIRNGRRLVMHTAKEMDRNGVPFIIPGMKYRDVIGGALDVGQGIIAPDPRSKLRAFNRNLIRSGKYVGKANDAIANVVGGAVDAVGAGANFVGSSDVGKAAGSIGPIQTAFNVGGQALKAIGDPVMAGVKVAADGLGNLNTQAQNAYVGVAGLAGISKKAARAGYKGGVATGVFAAQLLPPVRSVGLGFTLGERAAGLLSRGGKALQRLSDEAFAPAIVSRAGRALTKVGDAQSLQAQQLASTGVARRSAGDLARGALESPRGLIQKSVASGIRERVIPAAQTRWNEYALPWLKSKVARGATASSTTTTATSSGFVGKLSSAAAWAKEKSMSFAQRAQTVSSRALSRVLEHPLAQRLQQSKLGRWSTANVPKLVKGFQAWSATAKSVRARISGQYAQYRQEREKREQRQKSSSTPRLPTRL